MGILTRSVHTANPTAIVTVPEFGQTLVAANRERIASLEQKGQAILARVGGEEVELEPATA
jgi:hypothetical protein